MIRHECNIFDENICNTNLCHPNEVGIVFMKYNFLYLFRTAFPIFAGCARPRRQHVEDRFQSFHFILCIFVIA